MVRNRLTMFSWGYEGWGNATKQLVQAVDRVEQDRGFEPPLFVDIRISRSVRAIGFRDTAFENAVGYDRYLWMDSLGNEAAKPDRNEGSNQRRPRPKIKNWRAADALLMIATENARRPRRIIFFCSCGWPVYRKYKCHRVEVGSLLLQAAKKRGVALEVVEWPGGSVAEVEKRLTSAQYRDALARATIPLGPSFPPAELLGLAWGSMVRLTDGKKSSAFFTGAAQFYAGGWRLHKLNEGLESEDSKAEGLAAGNRWRKDWCFEPRRSGTQ